jgi:DNA-binding MarR family transcriptional regulator
MVLRFTSADVRVSAWQDREQRITAALVAEPNCTDRSIGRRLGIDPHAVARVRRALERAGTIRRPTARYDEFGRRRRTA